MRPIYYEQAASLPLQVTVVGNDDRQSSMTLELPNLRVVFPPTTMAPPLDREEWLRWLKAKNVDTNNPAVQKEADEFISLLKRYNIWTPATSLTEFHFLCRASLCDYSPRGTTETGRRAGRFGAGEAMVLLYLALTALYLFIALAIRKAWLQRGRELVAAGESAVPQSGRAKTAP